MGFNSTTSCLAMNQQPTRKRTNSTPTHCSNKMFNLIICSYMSGSKKETSARWNEANKDSFLQRAAEEKIDITNVTPPYIEKICIRHWSGCSKLAFHTNYRAIASALHTENDIAVQK